MRRKFGFILLLIWLFQCSLPWLLYQYGRIELCSEASIESRRAESESVRLIYKDKQSVEWRDFGKELEWNGKLYDVENIKDSVGCIVIKAFSDTKEDRLLANFKKESLPASDKSASSNLKKWNELKCFSADNEEKASITYIYKKERSECLTLFPEDAFYKVQDPPPDIF